MSEEQVQTENQDESVIETDDGKYVSLKAFEELKKNLETVLEEKEKVQKVAQGQDKKNTELFSKISELEKEIQNRDEKKKSVEEQILDLQNELKQRDENQKLRDRESLVLKEIANNKLDPEMDYDYVWKAQTNEEIAERAKARVEYYEKIKSETIQSIANGSVPPKGDTQTVGKYDKMSDMELSKLSLDRPELSEEIAKIIQERAIAKEL